MIRCLVTDRRRLAGAGAPFDRARRSLLEQVANAVSGRVELVQVRERDLEAAALAALVDDILSVTRGTVSRVVVNDRLDVAIACRADGVHLRGDSFSAADARRLVPPGFLVGRSVHSADDARNAGECDYLIAGTVFPSISKGGAAALLGLDGLRAIASATRVPVLAIGGVTVERYEAVASAGASGVAGIGLFLPFDSPRPAS